uniref:NADH dehydrogenase subunit 3 n=1 Tax=Limnocentropus hysbald TaxID=1875661 RepID=UPI0022DCE062|nr:NADH dehydrogenase subunit 3 [Limnocentropus hysbald]UZZ44123.1 NADH dehydrogenase subunit 3 [Limnocentropus hysbald]
MFIMSQMFITLMIISTIILTISLILSKKSFHELEKLSPFECGFDPITSARLPFSLHFFLITIIFLIFDVEIALIIPIIIILNTCNLTYWFLTTMIFITILLLGLYHEWNQKMLMWSN